jgi:hypothetical protein
MHYQLLILTLYILYYWKGIELGFYKTSSSISYKLRLYLTQELTRTRGSYHYRKIIIRRSFLQGHQEKLKQLNIFRQEVIHTQSVKEFPAFKNPNNMEVGPEAHAETTKYIFMSRHENATQS